MSQHASDKGFSSKTKERSNSSSNDEAFSNKSKERRRRNSSDEDFSSHGRRQTNGIKPGIQNDPSAMHDSISNREHLQSKRKSGREKHRNSHMSKLTYPTPPINIKVVGDEFSDDYSNDTRPPLSSFPISKITSNSTQTENEQTFKFSKIPEKHYRRISKEEDYEIQSAQSSEETPPEFKSHSIFHSLTKEDYMSDLCKHKRTNAERLELKNVSFLRSTLGPYPDETLLSAVDGILTIIGYVAGASSDDFVRLGNLEEVTDLIPDEYLCESECGSGSSRESFCCNDK